MSHRLEGIRDALDEALALAALGLFVFPIRQTRWRPMHGRWAWPGTAEPDHPRHLCSNDPEELRALDWEHCWVGVRPEPSGIIVVDADRNHEKTRPGVDGVAEWQKLCDRHGCPPAPFQLTPRGGMHFFFRRRHAARLRISNRLGIDIVGKGGCNIAGPGYRWVSPLMPVDELPEVPGWLDNIIAGGWR